MTTGEAIAYWEVFQREIDELYPLFDESVKATLDEQREPVALALSALRAQQELESNLKVLESNHPLTLDELRKMEGEPVWIVWADGHIKGQWWIVGNYDWHMMEFDDRYDYGKTWLAYRHKTEDS